MTHVTGIVSGNGYQSNGCFSGIAPKSNIISLKILDKNGQGTSSSAIAGLRWIMDNAWKYNIRVVNLSIGTNDRKQNRPLMEAVDRLWQQGITVVAAAGNPDGKRGYQPAPAISSKIITVGAWEDRYLYCQNRNGNALENCQNNMPNIWAPGEDIISVLSPDYCFDLQNRDMAKVIAGHYIKMSGTSMATPMVSGTVALLLEKYPRLNPDNVKNRILSACQKAPKEFRGLLNIGACLV